jgi:hypothetical protein
MRRAAPGPGQTQACRESRDHRDRAPLVNKRKRVAFEIGPGLPHYDAVDALVYLILGLVGEGNAPQEVHYV